MRILNNFIGSILGTVIAAVSGLLICGAILTWVESGWRYDDSFFTYRIQSLDYLPAWFAATLLLLSVNGLWMYKLARIEGAFHTPPGTGWGEWGASLPINPLRLFAVNLVAIPVTLGLFILMRANYL